MTASFLVRLEFDVMLSSPNSHERLSRSFAGLPILVGFIGPNIEILKNKRTGKIFGFSVNFEPESELTKSQKIQDIINERAVQSIDYARQILTYLSAEESLIVWLEIYCEASKIDFEVPVDFIEELSVLGVELVVEPHLGKTPLIIDRLSDEKYEDISAENIAIRTDDMPDGTMSKVLDQLRYFKILAGEHCKEISLDNLIIKPLPTQINESHQCHIVTFLIPKFTMIRVLRSLIEALHLALAQSGEALLIGPKIHYFQKETAGQFNFELNLKAIKQSADLKTRFHLHFEWDYMSWVKD